MAFITKGQTKLNFTLLPRTTRKALDYLSKQVWMENSNWYLAGGTALALSAGTRKSVDLDFFTEAKEFSGEELLSHFIDNKNWRTGIHKKNTIYGTFFNAQISFIVNPAFIPKQDPLRFGSIKILQPLDIAVMKIIAISQRGRKRDFFDVYWCAKNIEPLENTIKRLRTQYPSVAHNYHHILKSLVFFEDAENDPIPDIHFEVTWKQVKNYFVKEIPLIAKNIIKLR